MGDDLALIARGDAAALPLADGSVDLVVTSPPYWGLRSYSDGGEHYDGQIGSESDPAAFIEALLDVTRELVRVLKPSGSLWVNLGDKYSRSGGGGSGSSDGQNGRHARPASRAMGAPEKSLVGFPWRYALRCIDDLGLILRAEVVWSKPNGLPESVTDRVRRSHETWFHFTIQGHYFSALDEIREEHLPQSVERSQRQRLTADRSQDGVGSPNTVVPAQACNPLGRMPGSVWSIPTQPLVVPTHLGIDHFAAFPPEWPRRLILGFSPSGVCLRCGDGRRPVVDTDQEPYRAATSTGRPKRQDLEGTREGNGWNGAGYAQTVSRSTIVGYRCRCVNAEAPTRPAVVLDPFGGTGTTAMVARALGRIGISLDLSADYSRLARWRVFHSGHNAQIESRTNADRQGTLC